jgi:hypothetical protein
VYAALAVMFAFTHYFALFALAAQAGFVLYLLLRAADGIVRELFRPIRRGSARLALMGLTLVDRDAILV